MKHNKQPMRINESQLRQIIKEALNELDWKTYANAAKKQQEIDLSQEPNGDFWSDNETLEHSRSKKFADAAAREFNKKYGYNNVADNGDVEDYSMDMSNEFNYDDDTGELYSEPGDIFTNADKKGHRLRLTGNRERRIRINPYHSRTRFGNDGIHYDRDSNYNYDISDELRNAEETGNKEVLDYASDKYDYSPDNGWHLKESKLNKIIKESVKNVLNEGYDYDDGQYMDYRSKNFNEQGITKIAVTFYQDDDDYREHPLIYLFDNIDDAAEWVYQRKHTKIEDIKQKLLSNGVLEGWGFKISQVINVTRK